jgi:hypothetical protein
MFLLSQILYKLKSTGFVLCSYKISSNSIK